MFSRAKDSSTPSKDMPTPPVPPKRGGRAAPSIISSDLVVNGNLTAGGDIQVDGTVEGDIRSVSLTIGEKATITGNVVADEVTIRGRVMGSVRARKVQLCSSCHVEGDILHEALAVETGAFFEGNCRHSDDPLSEAAPAAKSAPASSAAPKSGDAAASSSRSSFLQSMGSKGEKKDSSGVVVKNDGVVVKRPAAQ